MKIIYPILLILILNIGCSSIEQESHTNEEHGHEEEHGHLDEVHLSEAQFSALGIRIDTLHKRVMSGFIETNGQLTLPPKSQAAVTSIVGANIGSIEVIEGNSVAKGQVLAYMYHPNLIDLQTQYADQVRKLEYLEQEDKRQEKLYKESVGSGRDFQKVRSEYLSLKASVKGMEAKLRLLSISPEAVREGNIQEQVSLRSPISGFVQGISVRTGQYVGPEEVLFELVDNDHIHAHFNVFESDVHKVKEGQTVQFTVVSAPNVQHKATIFSVGKVFDSNVKAINVHAELDNEDGSLLAGMYVRGKVIVESTNSLSLPKEAVAMEGSRYFVFKVEKVKEEGKTEWHLNPSEVSVGVENDGWLEIKLHEEYQKDVYYAHNKAYYLISELMKEEAEHDH